MNCIVFGLNLFSLCQSYILLNLQVWTISKSFSTLFLPSSRPGKLDLGKQIVSEYFLFPVLSVTKGTLVCTNLCNWVYEHTVLDCFTGNRRIILSEKFQLLKNRNHHRCPPNRRNPRRCPSPRGRRYRPPCRTYPWSRPTSPWQRPDCQRRGFHCLKYKKGNQNNSVLL